MKLIKYLLMAYRGRLLWKKMRKKYGFGDPKARYILFPSEDEEYNHWGCYYLPDYVKNNKIGYLIILSFNDGILEKCTKEPDVEKSLLKISKRDMACLIKFAALVNMMNEWTIVSVKEPYDTGAERLLGKKGVTKREIVWYDVYRMSELPR